MDKKITILKGIHPGLVIERELSKRHLPKGRLALAIKEYPQTIGAITKGKRNLNTALSLKIEKELGMEEGYLMILQLYHDIKKLKEKSSLNATPDLSIIQKSTFWDTDIQKIDWQKKKNAVILRVQERGTEEEKNEITRFYGKDTVTRVLQENLAAAELRKNIGNALRFIDK